MNRCCPRRDPSRPVAVALEDEQGVKLAFTVGTMIELPRAAMAAAEIAEAAEFFSFGTNDLTQMTWGFSRDDVETPKMPFSRYSGKNAASTSSRETPPVIWV